MYKKKFLQRKEIQITCCGSLVPVSDKYGKVIAQVCNMCNRQYLINSLNQKNYHTR